MTASAHGNEYSLTFKSGADIAIYHLFEPASEEALFKVVNEIISSTDHCFEDLIKVEVSSQASNKTYSNSQVIDYMHIWTVRTRVRTIYDNSVTEIGLLRDAQPDIHNRWNNINDANMKDGLTFCQLKEDDPDAARFGELLYIVASYGDTLDMELVTFEEGYHLAASKGGNINYPPGICISDKICRVQYK